MANSIFVVLTFYFSYFERVALKSRKSNMEFEFMLPFNNNNKTAKSIKL